MSHESVPASTILSLLPASGMPLKGSSQYKLKAMTPVMACTKLGLLHHTGLSMSPVPADSKAERCLPCSGSAAQAMGLLVCSAGARSRTIDTQRLSAL